VGDLIAKLELESIPAMPPMAGHVWAAFLDLCRTRQSSGMGPGPITRHDIRAWEADEFTALEPWERRAILALDTAWLRSQQPDTQAKEAST
jgi:hypothetical protein